jgi:hypothetical protein
LGEKLVSSWFEMRERKTRINSGMGGKEHRHYRKGNIIGLKLLKPIIIKGSFF